MMTLNGYGNASAQANNAYGQADMTMPQQQPLGLLVLDNLGRLEEKLCRAHGSLLSLRGRIFGEYETRPPTSPPNGNESSSLESALHGRLIALQLLADELLANSDRLEARI